MIKKSLLWVLYFILCGTVIALAIDAGGKMDHCHECVVKKHGK
jgi:hypothetical protein